MIDASNRIILYGVGKRCDVLLNLLNDRSVEIVGVIDSNPAKWGMKFHGFEVLPPEELNQHKDALICVTFFSPLEDEPVWRVLKDKYGVDYSHVCSFHELVIRIFKDKSNNFDFIPDRKKIWQCCFDTTWKQGLGGVESWLRDIREGFESRDIHYIKWLTYNEYGISVEDYTPFSYEYVKAGIKLISGLLPCTIVFSRVNELLLAAHLIKQRYPEKIKIIMTVHGICDGMYRDVLSYVDSIDLFVCISSAMKRYFESKGIAQCKLSVMTIPVQHDKIFDRLYQNRSDMPVRLGYAGRLEIFQKRVDVLLKLLIELDKRGVDFRAFIAGIGEQESLLYDGIKENGLEERAHLLGNIDKNEIPKFWKECDVALNTSDFEGRPLSNMEAMLAGCVPVVTSTQGVLDDVKDGDNGYVVLKGDYMTMADRIEYLSKHRELLKVMGERARNEMLSKTNKDKHLDFWIKLMEN